MASSADDSPESARLPLLEAALADPKEVRAGAQSLDDLIYARQQVSAFNTWWHSAMFMEEFRFLELLVADFQEFRRGTIDLAPYQFLSRIFLLEQQFMCNSEAMGLSNDLFQMFRLRVEERFQPVPTVQDLKDFGEFMMALKSKKFPEDAKLQLELEHWGKALHVSGDKRFEQYKALVKQKQEEFALYVLEQLASLKRRFSHTSLLVWLADSLAKAAKRGQYLFLATSEWRSLYEVPHGEVSVMQWTRIGYVIQHLIQQGKLGDQDVEPSYTEAAPFRALKTVIVPNFAHNMERLLRVQQAGLDTVNDAKNKTLAFMVTIGAALGQVLAKYAMQQLGFEGEKNCD